MTYRITDPVAAASVVADADQTLYREAQLALRAAVGGADARPAAGRQAVRRRRGHGACSRAAAASSAPTVKGVGLRDIILPGDMKALLNQVVAAEKEAEANLIRRREETASVRSQANTAKLLADNPRCSASRSSSCSRTCWRARTRRSCSARAT